MRATKQRTSTVRLAVQDGNGKSPGPVYAAGMDDARVDKFCAWLENRNRSEGTVALYRRNLVACLDHPKGPLARLRDKALAPMTKRHNLATLKQWAKFTKDADLREELDDIRLPPARRLNPKRPLETQQWQQFVRAVEAAKWPDYEKATVLVMARRGLRLSDVLRIERSAVVSAIASSRLSYEAKGGKLIEISAVPVMPQLQLLADYSGWARVLDLFEDLDMKHAGQKVRRRVRAAGKDLGIAGVHPHQLRRSYAMFFLEKHRGDPRALVKLVEHMSWSSIQVASNYIDSVNSDELDKIGAEMMEDLLRE